MIRLLFKREWRLWMHRLPDVGTVLAFNAMVISVFPLALGSDTGQLKVLAPAVIWVTVLLSVLLGLKESLEQDVEDGSLEVLWLVPVSPIVLVIAKYCGLLAVIGLPLVLITPILGMMLGMEEREILLLLASLIVGTPSLLAIGLMGEALTVGSRKASGLLPLIVLPLAVPILIFGAALPATATQYAIQAFFGLIGILLVMLPISLAVIIKGVHQALAGA